VPVASATTVSTGSPTSIQAGSSRNGQPPVSWLPSAIAQAANTAANAQPRTLVRASMAQHASGAIKNAITTIHPVTRSSCHGGAPEFPGSPENSAHPRDMADARGPGRRGVNHRRSS
jgi:hypothetical protein